MFNAVSNGTLRDVRAKGARRYRTATLSERSRCHDGPQPGYTQVSNHIRERQESIGIGEPVYSGQK